MTSVANCPGCKSFRSIVIQGNRLACRDCEFKLQILCIHCGIGPLVQAEKGLVCQHCSQCQTENQLAYIIANRLKVSMEDRCQYCNRPTLSKADANIGPRCVDHPHCANQTMLFDASVAKKAMVFLDFETTGLEIGNESIIEIGACKVDADGKEYFFQELVRPVSPIQPLISKITGITDSMVTHSPSLKEVLDAFLVFSGDAKIVAHNAQFDVPWLLVSLMRHGYDIPFSEVCCTLMWAKKIENGKRSLGALSKKYDIGHENAHRALADAVVTKELFYKYSSSASDEPFESLGRYTAMSTKIMQQYSGFNQP